MNFHEYIYNNGPAFDACKNSWSLVQIRGKHKIMKYSKFRLILSNVGFDNLGNFYDLIRCSGADQHTKIKDIDAV